MDVYSNEICFSSPYQVYVTCIALSSIYITSSTIYMCQKYIFSREGAVRALQGVSLFDN